MIHKILFWLWIWTRPKVIREMAYKYPPWVEYKIKSTGQTAILYSYSEDGTVTVDIFSEQLRVFGIDIDDLEPI